MPEGLIVKALSGYYYVLPDASEAKTIQCRGRGILRMRNVSPLVGDRVIYELTENGEGSVDEILPRTSELIRPPIANVNQVVLVFSFDEPALNLNLLDKFLVHTEYARLKTVIVFTKSDLVDENKSVSKHNPDVSEVMDLYREIGYEVMMTSAKEGIGTELVLEALRGHISVFSGQSGVGKSTLLNAIIPGLKLETNEISMKLGRGKHTTRHVELHHLDNGGIVADTPGFSQLDFLEIEPEDLNACFIEFGRYSPQCKFRGCFHLNEPKCQVIDAKEKGLIASSRYEHYLAFLNEMKDRKRRY